MIDITANGAFDADKLKKGSVKPNGFLIEIFKEDESYEDFIKRMEF